MRNRSISVLLWIAISIFLNNIGPSLPILKAPHIPYEALVKRGHLNLGALYSARDRSNDISHPCAGKITRFRFQQNIEAIAYTIDQINANQSILPNVTLGYAILDDCRYGITALGKATRFLPVDNCVHGNCENYEVNGIYDPANNWTDIKTFYDVVGVVGATSSSKAVLVSSLLGAFHIPVISPEATSDVLTDSFDHHYFLRVISPDRFQAEAMMALIEKFNWTYISVLYTEGSYGTNLFRQIQKSTREKHICIAYYQEISQEFFTENDFKKVVSNLRKNANAKVVILVLDIEDAQGVLSAVKRANAQGEFIWIGSEAFDARSFTNFESEAVGAFSLAVPLTYVSDFANHFLQLNPLNNLKNPWYKPLWESLFHCTWDSDSIDDVPCSSFHNISHVDDYYFSNWTSRTIDAVLVYANALHALIEDHCTHAVGNKDMLRKCVTGPLLLEYLHKVSFLGTSGYVEFDSDGDLLGNYEVKQLVLEENAFQHMKIGLWQSKDNSIKFDEAVNWYLNDYQTSSENDTIPLSVCSFPCEVGQVAIPGELPCCWHCRTCRDNEIAWDNISSCIECPYLTWPDQNTRSLCLKIPPSYLRWTDLFGIFLTALDAVGFFLLSSFTVFFVIYKEHKIIKASSIPLGILIITGLSLAFLTSFMLKGRPGTPICSFGHVGYHISCTLIYATLFVKTNRIYRIFKASKKCQRPRGLMDMQSQVALVLTMVTIQVLLMFATVVANNIMAHPDKSISLSFIPSSVELNMPVRTAEFVELKCNRPRVVLLAPLSFNIFMLILCAMFAFLTRQLPDAFNESWYILLSVTTTLIIWMAFIPTYFLTFYAQYKEALLSLALSLNSFCNLLLLFGPKIYAIFYVEEDKIKMGFDDMDNSSRVSKKNLATKIG